jgi:hypothetical protein
MGLWLDRGNVGNGVDGGLRWLGTFRELGPVKLELAVVLNILKGHRPKLWNMNRD